jgi:mannose-1-phosphate guanylyltransferase
MYAVIMAGGGGTRLHPLSRPERPKPFLPLTSTRTLLQATVDRVADLVGGRVWVVADGRYRRLVEDQTPEARLLAEPMGRNTAAAIALATLAIDEPEDEVMLVLPADQTIEDVEGFQRVLRGAETLAQGSFDIESPLVTLGVQHHQRPATEYGYLIPKGDGADVAGLHAYPLQGFEEKPNPARAEELVRQPGVAWNAGMFLWRRRAIRAALERHTGFIQSLGPMTSSPTMLQQAYESIQRPMSIDHAVMEGAAGRGQVVMGSMDVGWSDLGSWTALLEGIQAKGTGSVVKAGDSVEVDVDDLVIRRTDGRLGVVAPFEPGRMTAMQPIAVLHGAAADRAKVEALIDRCADPEQVA